MAIHNSFLENVVSIENEEIQQNEEEQTFEENQNPQNVQRNLFGEFNNVALDTEETEEYGSDGDSEYDVSEQEDDSSDGIIDYDLLHWNDINFSWDIDNVHDLIYGINLREDVSNLSIHAKYILFDWNDMNFYFELTDDGMISMEIGTQVYQKFMISIETENRGKKLVPVEHYRNYHRNEEYTDAIGDLFPHIDTSQFYSLMPLN